jgi:hypothetical protein
MKKGELKREVMEILMTSKDSRDNDNLLIAIVWGTRVKGHTNTYAFLEALSQGNLPSTETICRLRRQIQEKDPSLRGEKYNERMGKQEEVKKDLGY